MTKKYNLKCQNKNWNINYGIFINNNNNNNNIMSNTDIFVGVIRTYHDEEKTKLKEEYFINAGKKEGIYKSY